jgi:hypothetical protein
LRRPTRRRPAVSGRGERGITGGFRRHRWNTVAEKGTIAAGGGTVWAEGVGGRLRSLGVMRQEF